MDILATSPESQTTVVPVALSWSREEDMVVVCTESMQDGAWMQ